MKPLVSYCLMSCRQPLFIEAALRSALDQDYSPLEVVVSDDFSQDGTWEIIQKVVADYKGPHKIVLNRNEPNLGTIGNWQKLCSLASGELLIKADGDDVAYPYRASEIVKAWESSGRRAKVFASSYDMVDEAGRFIGEKLFPDGQDVRTMYQIATGVGYFYLGAVMAIHRSLFDEFKPISFLKSSDCAVFEARGLICRETIAREGLYFPFWSIGRKLIQYRVGSGDTTGGGYRKFQTKGAQRVLEARKQTLKDLEETASRYLPSKYCEEVRAFYKKSVEEQEVWLSLLLGDSFSVRWNAYRRHCGGMKRLSKANLIGVVLLLPRTLGDVIFRLLRA